MKDEELKYIPKQKKRSRKRYRRNRTDEGTEAPGKDPGEATESYHPVRCSECNTEVAVLDSEEVFHFFNVIASAPT